jgi:hypothetical protein
MSIAWYRKSRSCIKARGSPRVPDRPSIDEVSLLVHC